MKCQILFFFFFFSFFFVGGGGGLWGGGGNKKNIISLSSAENVMQRVVKVNSGEILISSGLNSGTLYTVLKSTLDSYPKKESCRADIDLDRMLSGMWCMLIINYLWYMYCHFSSVRTAKLLVVLWLTFLICKTVIGESDTRLAVFFFFLFFFVCFFFWS